MSQRLRYLYIASFTSRRVSLSRSLWRRSHSFLPRARANSHLAMPSAKIDAQGNERQTFLLRFADEPLDLAAVQQQPAAGKRLMIEGPSGAVLRDMAIHQPDACPADFGVGVAADWPCLRAGISPRCPPRPCQLPSFQADGSYRRRRDSGQRLPARMHPFCWFSLPIWPRTVILTSRCK